jgi:hypothetical protein
MYTQKTVNTMLESSTVYLPLRIVVSRSWSMAESAHEKEEEDGNRPEDIKIAQQDLRTLKPKYAQERPIEQNETKGEQQDMKLLLPQKIS